MDGRGREKKSDPEGHCLACCLMPVESPGMDFAVQPSHPSKILFLAYLSFLKVFFFFFLIMQSLQLLASATLR